MKKWIVSIVVSIMYGIVVGLVFIVVKSILDLVMDERLSILALGYLLGSFSDSIFKPLYMKVIGVIKNEH